MKVQALGLILTVVAANLEPATSFSSITKGQARLQNPSSAFKTALVLRSGGSGAEDDSNLKDFSGQATALFGNIRIPAALFAGASAGAAFAMPISATSEGLKIGLVKRIYALLMMSSLTSEIIAIVVGTGVANALANDDTKSSSVTEFLNTNYALEWTATRFHFLFGVLTFVEGIGLRAWVTIGCPIFAKAALGMVITTALLCAAFVEDITGRIAGTCDSQEESFSLPLRYLRLLTERAMKKPLFGLAYISMVATFSYLAFNGPHIWHYLAGTMK